MASLSRLVTLCLTAVAVLLVVWSLYSGFPFTRLDQAVVPLLGASLPASLSAATLGSLRSIENTTLGFQHILAINLPERTDHKDGLLLAAAVSNISIQFIDGVHDDSVSPKALPRVQFNEDLPPGIVGSWRAHVNALSRVVQEGWGSALILEDDVDWDVRLRGQLQQFAVSSSYLMEGREEEPSISRLQDIESVKAVRGGSPYGVGWDVLWLGHCGMEVANHSSVVVNLDDPTVAEVEHLVMWNGEPVSGLRDYPQHTRLVLSQQSGACSLAYAVSQAGARKLLYRFGLQQLDGAVDMMLREFCEGINGNDPHVCLTVLPQLFDHHRPVGRVSDQTSIGPGIGDYGEVREKAYTLNIRQSVRMNMERLLTGDTDYVDQWPDSGAV